MLINNAVITGSLTVNGTDVTYITGSSQISSSFLALSSSYLITSASYVVTSGSYAITSASFAQTSGSLSIRTGNLEATSSTLTSASSSFAAQSASLSTRLTTDETNITTLTNASASFAAQSASLSTRLTTDETNFSTTSGSLSTRVTNLEATSSTVSSSFASTSGSIAGRVTLIEGQYATTGSNTFTGVQSISSTVNAQGFTTSASLYTDGGARITKDLFVSGTTYLTNLTVYGTASVQYITSSQINVGANIIYLNTQTPAVRYGGMAVADSGSNAGVTGSMLWDSVNNGWIYTRESGSTYSGGALISGPRSSVQGSEQGTVANYVMKGQGGDHITGSQIYTDDSSSYFYTNVLYVTASGNVGIGTTSPLSKFQVKTTTDQNFKIDAGTTLTVFATNDADSAYVPITFRASKFDFENGNVGIGIPAPSASLHVSGNIYATQGSNYQAPDVDCLLYLAGENSSKRRLEIDAYTPSGPVIKGRQSNGTFSSPTPTLLDNVLLYIDAAGSEIVAGATTASFIPGFQGYTRLMAAENFTTSSRGTYWDWGVIPTGSITLTTGLMQLRSTGLTVNAPVIGTAFNNTTSTAYAKFIPSTAYSKKLVVFGSSVALGVGATDYHGWAWMLGQTLASGSWTYTNASIGGNTTVDLINRFYTDLVPLQPDVVIIALSLANEGILNPTGKELIFQQYVNNLYQLVDMCRQQGFKVIVTGCYPNNSYTSVEYNYIKQADKFLQTSQIPYINFLGSVDNGSGQWRTGMYYDALHPNDIGHTAMYRAIPITLFDRLSYVQEDYKLNYPPLSTIQMAGDTTTASPIIYTPGTEPFGSWTFMLNVRYIPNSSQGIALLAVYNGTSSPLRVRNPGLIWEIATTSTILSSAVKPYDGYSSQIALTYDYYTDTVTFYVDGVNYGSSSTGGYGANPTAFTVFGRPDAPSVNANGYQVSNIAIYKAALNADQILECYRGFYPKSSLEVFSPCTDASLVSGSSLLNLAISKASLLIQSPSINSGSFQGNYPITVTDTTYTLFPNTTTVIFNPTGTCTVTLPDPVAYFGKTYTFKNSGSYAINNVSGSVVPLAGGTPTTSILAGTAGKYAVVQSNGTYWEIIQSN